MTRSQQQGRRERRNWRSRLQWLVGGAVAAGVAMALGVAGWRVCGRYGERCEGAARFPSYDADTGAIDLVMHDLNGNGVIDTWIYRNGEAIEEIEIDRDEDGTIDRILVPDEQGALRLADASRSQ